MKIFCINLFKVTICFLLFLFVQSKNDKNIKGKVKNNQNLDCRNSKSEHCINMVNNKNITYKLKKK